MLWRHAKDLLTILLNLYVKYQLPTPRFLVGDGSFGNQYYVQLSRKMGLHLISKLKKNAVLLWPASAAERQQCKTKPKKYGKRIDVKKLPAKYLVRTYHDKKKGTLTKIYQLKAYNKRVSKELLNIVVIQEVQLATQKTKAVILFSTDLALAAQKLRQYYQLRFVIEIDFRDAKQYFGLRSFKNVKEQQVTNALQIAVTAKLVGQIYSEQIAKNTATEPYSILDLKTYIRTHHYIQNIIKYMPQVPKDFLSPRNILKIAQNEMIRRKKAA
jgi:putative transposase